jgi:hypothetical protein
VVQVADLLIFLIAFSIFFAGKTSMWRVICSAFAEKAPQRFAHHAPRDVAL